MAGRVAPGFSWRCNPRYLRGAAPLRFASRRDIESFSCLPVIRRGRRPASSDLRSGQRVYLHRAPSGWDLADPPDGLTDAGPDGPADVIIAFFTAAAQIAGDLDGLARRIYPAGALWVAWPRRAGGHRSDITDTVIREHALPMGLVDVKVAAIDENWSGLRLVWRVENRR